MSTPRSAKIAIAALEIAKKISPQAYERLVNAYINRNPIEKPKTRYAYALAEVIELGRNHKLLCAETYNKALDSVLYTAHFANGGENIFNAPVVEKLGAEGCLDDIVTRLSNQYSPQSSSLISSIAYHGGLKHLSTEVLNNTLEKIVTEQNMSHSFSFENRLCMSVLTSPGTPERVSRKNINNILLIASKVGDKYGHEILKIARDCGVFPKLNPETAKQVVENVESQIADASKAIDGQQNAFTQIDDQQTPRQIAERVEAAVANLPESNLGLFY